MPGTSFQICLVKVTNDLPEALIHRYRCRLIGAALQHSLLSHASTKLSPTGPKPMWGAGSGRQIGWRLWKRPANIAYGNWKEACLCCASVSWIRNFVIPTPSERDPIAKCSKKKKKKPGVGIGGKKRGKFYSWPQVSKRGSGLERSP